jgi:uncharacterized protein YecT (DUF1311 family)
MVKILKLILFTLISGALQGQITDLEEKHPIDIRLEECLSIDSNASTSGMINCVEIAAAEWDKELNKYYKLLMGLLQPSEKIQLKAAQISWLGYLEKEKGFAASMYQNMQGSMWIAVSAQRSSDIIRKRVMELKEYYDNLGGE